MINATLLLRPDATAGGLTVSGMIMLSAHSRNSMRDRCHLCRRLFGDIRAWFLAAEPRHVDRGKEYERQNGRDEQSAHD